MAVRPECIPLQIRHSCRVYTISQWDSSSNDHRRRTDVCGRIRVAKIARRLTCRIDLLWTSGNQVGSRTLKRSYHGGACRAWWRGDSGGWAAYDPDRGMRRDTARRPVHRSRAYSGGCECGLAGRVGKRARPWKHRDWTGVSRNACEGRAGVGDRRRDADHRTSGRV